MIVLKLGKWSNAKLRGITGKTYTYQRIYLKDGWHATPFCRRERRK